MIQKSILLLLMVCGAITIQARDLDIRVDVNKSFPDITQVEIKAFCLDVIIEPHDANEVKLDGFVEWDRSKEKYEIQTNVYGGKLVITVKHPHSTRGRVDGKLYLKMPALTDIDVESISGNINVTGIGKKYADFETISGDITAKKIGCSVEAESISGEISLENIAGDVETSTISGDQQFHNIDGDLNGSSISGDFTISDLKGNRKVSSVSGSIR
ncbi:hypothetical protein DMA11_11535 [Marinilabiliaceae bacterium JC017]|nr:hypothetical protein DMA11_11535 [Marinilabiliaceae bacterium JC017]